MRWAWGHPLGLARAAPVEICAGVRFATVAREWRCKWSADDDKASLQAAQGVLDSNLPALKALPGFQSVQRVVCGGCLDFKIITALEEPKFGEWDANGFAPEADVLAALKAVPGISQVETQTFTLEEM